MIKWTSNTNLYPRFDVFFSAGYTDDLFPFMSVFSQFLSRGWPKKKTKVRKQRKGDLAMFSSYLLNKTAELFIKFLHCLICVVGISTLSVWKPISMFTCGAVFLGVTMSLISENVIWNHWWKHQKFCSYSWKKLFSDTF